MNTTVRAQLWVMMFLQFFVWGAWAVTMGTYLDAIGFDGAQIGRAYSTTAWGAVVAPFFIGMIADRFFNAERVMGILHLLGAGLMYWASTITEPGLFFWVLLAYALCYMPTLGLVNAISFNQMTDPGKEFPAIRVLGTIGWIIAGLLYMIIDFATIGFDPPEGAISVEATATPLRIAALASIALGIFSFFLPRTPPKSTGKSVSVGDVLGLEALALMKKPSFLVFTVCSVLICIPLAFYYNFTNLFLNEGNMQYTSAKMSMGQMSEIAFMLVMPFFFVRLGVKKMLLIGMVAWAIRYVLFAFGNMDSLVFMYYGGILLHGICYDFFFVTGQIYVDREAPKEIQASAQGFIALATYGVGMLIGANLSGMIVEQYALEGGGHDWQTIWLIPAGMALVVCIGFAALFRDPPAVEAAPEIPPTSEDAPV